MKSTELGKVRELAWSSESVKVRRACVAMLTGGTVTLDAEREDEASAAHAIEDVTGLKPQFGPQPTQVTFVLEGVKCTYGPEDLFEEGE